MYRDSSIIHQGAVIGQGVNILPFCIIEEGVVIGDNCTIGPNAHLKNCTIGKGATVNSSQIFDSTVGDCAVIGPFSYMVNGKIGTEATINASQIYDSVVEQGAKIGPYVHLRPNSHVGVNCRVGNFVEIKNSNIGNGTKVSHLTYVGDTDVGERCNFGCGTVTVNYDGFGKFRTTIGDDVFLGCNTNLIAPVTLGNGAYTAAGSTVTEDVPEDALVIARSKQTVIEKWAAEFRAKRKK